MKPSDHPHNGVFFQDQLKGETEGNGSADQVGKSKEMARLGKSVMSSKKYERHDISCCCPGRDTIKSVLASPLGRELPPKKRKLDYWLRVEEEVADSDDPTVDSKLVVPEVQKMYAVDAIGEVICQMTQGISCIPDCQSETPDLTCKRLKPYELTSKAAPLQSDSSKDSIECKAGKKLKK